VIGRGPSTDLAVLKIDVPDLPTAENSRGSRVDRYLRLDLTLYPGSSGAAFAGATGLVLGLATSALSRVAPIPIPASTIDRVVDELLRQGHISRSYLVVGLQPVPLPNALTRRIGRSQAAAAIVLSVEPDGPADRAGILIGDLLIELAGEPVPHLTSHILGGWRRGSRRTGSACTGIRSTYWKRSTGIERVCSMTNTSLTDGPLPVARWKARART
jgi:S1-C subfamily serine protease